MTREQILTGVKNYFDIKELVDESVFTIHGDNAWQFLDTNLLECLLIVREGLDNSITVNNWSWKGRFGQRGLRHNRSSMVTNKTKPYLSAHMMGKAVDFNVANVEPNEVRNWIENNADLFPCKIRLERKLKGNYINWVHLDVFQNEKNPKIYLFDV